MADEKADDAGAVGHSNPNRCFEVIFLVSQVVIGVLYALCTEYGEGVHPAFTTEGDLDAKDAM